MRTANARRALGLAAGAMLDAKRAVAAEAASPAARQPAALRSEYAVALLGLDEPHPRFSW